MKILKPGKVEQRRFVCKKCECEFVAGFAEMQLSTGYSISCPCCRDRTLWWDKGDPYEEPTTQTGRERLAHLIEDAPVSAHGTIDTAFLQVADYLLQNGVTFKEEK